MDDKKIEMTATLLEELVIARGLIREICDARGIPEPLYSISRMNKAIHQAKEIAKDSFPWISVNDRLPESQKDTWSEDVIALSDLGDVFRLACMGGYWQRSQAFVDSGAKRVTHWMPLIYPD